MIRQIAVAFSIIGSLGLAAQPANANVTSAPGIAFIFPQPSGMGNFPLTGLSYGAAINSSGQFISATANVPFPTNSSTLYITAALSSQSYCYALVFSGNSVAWGSGSVYGQGSGIGWQTLNLGQPWGLALGMTLKVECSLEPGAAIGLVWQ
jgi:hypothetical protein